MDDFTWFLEDDQSWRADGHPLPCELILQPDPEEDGWYWSVEFFREDEAGVQHFDTERSRGGWLLSLPQARQYAEQAARGEL